MTSFRFWNKYRRDGWNTVADSDENSFKFEFASSRWVEYRRGFELVSLFFRNRFVVELLWPRRERRARMIVTVGFKIFNLLSTSLISEPDAEDSPRFIYGIGIVAMGRILSRVLELTESIESDAEANPRFVFETSVVAVGRILSRILLVNLILRFLNLLFNVVNGKRKLWHDFVISSLVFHNKMLSKKDTRNKNQMQRLNLVSILKQASSQWVEYCRGFGSSCNLFGETLKDYVMRVKERYKRSGSGAEASPRFVFEISAVAMGGILSRIWIFYICL